MFSTGNFRNFPIDDDVSIGSVSDLNMSVTLSHSITSFDMSVTEWARDESSRTRPFSKSLDSLDELSSTATKHVDSYLVNNGHDLANSLTVVLSMPALCDVTFLVGPSLDPIHGLRAVMATRSIILQALFLSHENILKQSTQNKNEKRGILSKLFRRKSKGRKQSGRLVISLPEHEAHVFGDFVTYLHTGSVRVNTDNLIGLLRLADMYKVTDLSNACWDFSERCMTTQTVIKLLTDAQQHTHCPAIAQLTHKLLAHIDSHPRQILTTPAFLSAPPSVATTILTRPHLPISENDRVSSMLSWSRHQHRHSPADLPATVTKLLQCVNFSAVTNPHLRADVFELGYVPTMSSTSRRDTSLNSTIGRCHPTRSSTIARRRRSYTTDKRARIVSSTVAKPRQSLNVSRLDSLNRTRRDIETSSSGCDSGSGSL